MDGFPDPIQAMFQATQFVTQKRNLQNGQHIWVSGHGGAVGTVSAIVIDDAGPIPAGGPNLNIAFAVAAPHKAVKTPEKKKAAKAPAKAKAGVK